MNKIGVVIVTFNRLNQLKQALASFDGQTCAPAYLIVVNNASTDGTDAFLETWRSEPSSYPRKVLSLSSNTGGSGGFHAGLDLARTLDAQWIWLSDDDAFPEPNALALAEAFITSQGKNATNVAAFCGSVINGGTVDLSHRSTITRKGCRITELPCPAAEYERDVFAPDTITYVGIIIHRPHLLQAGLTEKDFFIWYDDAEHCRRLQRTGRLLCVPSIRIHHDTGVSNDGLSWKTYYGIRNSLVSFRRHFPWYSFLYTAAVWLWRGLKDLLRKETRQRGRLRLSAVNDAFLSRLGIHPVYRPGWKPNETL